MHSDWQDTALSLGEWHMWHRRPVRLILTTHLEHDLGLDSLERVLQASGWKKASD